MKIQFKTLLLAPLVVMASGCAMFGGDEAGPEDGIAPEKEAEESAESEKAAAAPDASDKAPVRGAQNTAPGEEAAKEPARITLYKESVGSSLKMCSMYAAPEALLGGGLIVALANPIVTVASVLYVVGDYGTCYYERQHDSEVEVDISAQVESARKKTSDELKDSFVKAKEKIDERANRLDRAIESMKKNIEDSAEKQKQDIERTGGRVLKELYEELHRVRNLEVPATREEDIEEYRPSPERYRRQIEESSDAAE